MFLAKALLVVAVSLVAVHPLAAHTVTCPAGDTPCVIAALVQAQGQEELTLILAAGVYTLTAPDPASTLEGATGLPLILTTVTIQGQGAGQTRLERAPTAPPFRLVSITETGTLTLRHVTLTGGVADPAQAERGGGVLNDGTLLCDQAVLSHNSAWVAGAIDNGGVFHGEHCAVTDNFGESVAGGIAALGPTSLDRSLVSGNISDIDGGLSFDPGAGLVDIRRTVFSDNLGLVLGGGGLGGNGQALLFRTVFTGNRANSRGGAIDFRGGGTLELRQSDIVRNSARDFGGGLMIEGGRVLAQNTTILENRALSGPDCFGPLRVRGNTIIGDPSGCQVQRPGE